MTNSYTKQAERMARLLHHEPDLETAFARGCRVWSGLAFQRAAFAAAHERARETSAGDRRAQISEFDTDHGPLTPTK